MTYFVIARETSLEVTPDAHEALRVSLHVRSIG